MNRSDSILKLAPALVAVQAAIKPAVKDATNPFFKSKYADLESAWEACKAALQANGFAVPQPTSGDGSVLKVETLLLHTSGEWLSGEIVFRCEGMTPQQMGSAITYARRYGLTSLLGIVAVEDDDAQAATQPQTRQPPPPRQSAPAAAGPSQADTLRASIIAATSEQALQALVPALKQLPAADLPALRELYSQRAEQLAKPVPPPSANESPVDALERRLRTEGPGLNPMAWTALVNELARLGKADADRVSPLFREISAARDAAAHGKAA